MSKNWEIDLIRRQNHKTDWKRSKEDVEMVWFERPSDVTLYEATDIPSSFALPFYPMTSSYLCHL